MDELIRKLEERRARIIEQRDALIATAEANVAGTTQEQRSAFDTATAAIRKLNTEELAPVDEQLAIYREQRDREARAAKLRSGDPGPVDGSATASGVRVTGEPTTYGEGSGHSFFLDQARVVFGKGDADGGVRAAKDRQERHEAELRVEMPKREALRRKQADQRIEDVLSGNASPGATRREWRMQRLERRSFERFLAAGGEIYEKRFISRTDGQGGYEVPPLWLVDQYIEYLRAGRTFADLWHNFPLPSGTDSINIPRLTIGTATGPQTGDGAPLPGRDITDSFVQGRVMTVAGQQDAAMQLLDQSPLNYDEIIFGDLAADYNMQFSAQLLLGSGFPQLTGLYPTGVLYGSAIGTTGPTTYGFYTAATGLTTAQWAGAASFYTGIAQLLSQLSRTRFLPPSALITNPAAWYALTAATDTTGRPLVVPAQQGNNFNQAGSDNDGPVAEGLVGHIQGLPWHVDPNIPLTFGGTGTAIQPYIGTISNGNTAPIPGSGGTSTNANVFTPAIAARWADLFVWEGDMRTRVLSEVLSGSLQVRFQLYAYAASIPNRYQNASSQPVSYGNCNSIGTLGAALSQGAAGGLLGF